MEAQGGEDLLFLLIHDLGTRRGWLVSVTPRLRFIPVERTPSSHWTGDWVGPRAGLDTEVRRKISCVCRGSNIDHPVRSQTLHWLSYPGSLSCILTNFIESVEWSWRRQTNMASHDIKIPIHKRRKCTTMLKRQQLTLSWARWTQSTASQMLL
jgi:hypothetical protein